jgi:2-polyprenyl-3-methyl-5-hydroxy-6-metoxy-1,4-benzoquinol methylase
MPSRYEAPVDPNAANNAHAYMLDMIGWNRSVLELGAAAGHITRALNEQDCRVTAVEYDPAAAVDLKQFAAEVIVGDLNDPSLFDAIPTQFDVVLAGDVLEHLISPQRVLSRAARMLLPGGQVVVSLPHVGHVDVRLSLLQGRFAYKELGLLDATHLRFFTLETVKELVKQSGLVITDLRRVRVAPFGTEQAVDPSSVSPAVLEAALQAPEAETYQFVFTAVKTDGNLQTERLAERNVELQDELARAQLALAAAEAQLESSVREADHRVDELRQVLRHADDLEDQLRIQREQLRVTEAEVAALNRTKTLRYTKIMRSGYRRLRGRASAE